ncbi:hypothetical protein CYMTET_24852 [Cymbomonas tetramitiformis]|uniref:Uncharacterized protein n=1 Tax=Cymbomonas tetramitiformis TaxID=36881 RepID=A0AAE0FV00_9CHLO|nr:hypothetical protein CYMTET_24852 [Cymbomonas tetramitiformis]|eukprot:gene9395-11131_t
MISTISQSQFVGVKVTTPRTSVRPACKTSALKVTSKATDSRRNALLALTALPALLLSDRASADPVKELAKSVNDIKELKVKPDVCARKACKIYPGSDGDYICRLYVPKSKEYKTVDGEVVVATSGQFKRVDCDMMLE